jgi:hypothetical protein
MKTASPGSTKDDPHVPVRGDCEREPINPSLMAVTAITLLLAVACSTTGERPTPTASAPMSSSSSDRTDIPQGGVTG